MKKIPENISIILKAIAPLVVLVVLFFLLGNIGFTKIRQIQGEILTAKSDKIMLTEKLNVLRNVSATGKEDSNAVTNSLPDNNPALVVSSQIKNLAAGSGLILSSLSSNSDVEGKEDIKSVVISFKITGQKAMIEPFLLNLRTIAPITVLSKVKISELNGVYSGEVATSSFWSSFPTQLPTNLEEFQELSEDDKEILKTINSLTQPVFLSLPPADGSGKINPFAE